MHSGTGRRKTNNATIHQKNDAVNKNYFAILFCIFAIHQTNSFCREPEKPNVVIILADDMGYGDVSFCNPDARTHTPNIDELARQGISFTDAHTAGALCVPSRYGLLTGRYFFRVPRQRSFWGYGAPLIEEGRVTVGSMMQKAGYTTACIGKWHLGLQWPVKDPAKPQIAERILGPTNTDFSGTIGKGPTTLGFDYSFIMPASLDMPPYVFVKNDRVVDPVIRLVNEIYPTRKPGAKMVWDQKYAGEDDIYWGRGIWWRNGEISASFRVENCLDDLVNEGISFIEQQAKENPDKPFMLYLPLTGPHTPWVPAYEFQGSSALGTYGDFMAHIDNVVYRVVETLKSLNIEENTLLIFTSDNGGHWSEEDKLTYAHQSNYGARGQKGDIWDGGHHVPFFVKWPAMIKDPATSNQTIGLIDIMATLSELTGQDIQESYAEDSYSFYPILKGNPGEPVRDQIVYLSARGKLSVKAGEWKYIEGLGSGGFTDPAELEPAEGGPTGQLYNLKQDPLEQNNLYLEEPEIVRQLSELLNSIVNR
jgi:arylsulfatase A-like enzyme